MKTIEVVCRGGCKHPPTHMARQDEDPPEATRLVYHNCNDNGASYHYEDANGVVVPVLRA